MHQHAKFLFCLTVWSPHKRRVFCQNTIYGTHYQNTNS